MEIMSKPHLGNSPQEVKDAAKNNDHQDDHHQDHVS